MTDTPAIAAVVIGRNEGAQLSLCLASIADRYAEIVYVDSGSTDDSLARAEAAGFRTHALDPNRPFTAARGRNEGAALTQAAFIQFIDGDCEMAVGWAEAAARFLVENPDVAVVAGRLREKRPDASLYNRLCDLEWAAPPGEAEAVGGIAMYRRDAFDAAGGFREDLMAGEEPEFCLRLRRAGWRIMRLPDEMALHDAAMTRFGEWWRRTARAGYAAAEGAALHWGSGERYNLRRLARALAWGLAAPLAILAGLAFTAHAAWAGLIYPAQILRLALRGGLTRDAWAFAAFNTIGKIAEAQGAIRFALRGRR